MQLGRCCEPLTANARLVDAFAYVGVGDAHPDDDARCRDPAVIEVDEGDAVAELMSWETPMSL